MAGNLVPRDLVKFDFEHAQCQRGPKYGPFFHCACSYSLLLFWVILRNKHGWISRVFLKRFFWVEDKETLKLSRNRKKRYGRDCLKIVGATAESLKRALRLN